MHRRGRGIERGCGDCPFFPPFHWSWACIPWKKCLDRPAERLLGIVTWSSALRTAAPIISYCVGWSTSGFYPAGHSVTVQRPPGLSSECRAEDAPPLASALLIAFPHSGQPNGFSFPKSPKGAKTLQPRSEAVRLCEALSQSVVRRRPVREYREKIHQREFWERTGAKLSK